jgi:hypothetical protein
MVLFLRNPLQIPETQCQTPKPCSLFQSITPELAYKRAASAGLIVIFHSFDDYDPYFREWVFWSLSTSFVVRLLCCLRDLRSADEFGFGERMIANDLINKGLLKKMVSDGKTYYYHLNEKTAARLLKQLLEIKQNE